MPTDRSRIGKPIPLQLKGTRDGINLAFIFVLIVFVSQLWFQWIFFGKIQAGIRPPLFLGSLGWLGVLYIWTLCGFGILAKGLWTVLSRHFVCVAEGGVSKPRFLRDDFVLYWNDIQKASVTVEMWYWIHLVGANGSIDIFLHAFEDIPATVSAIREHLPPGVELELVGNAESILRHLERRSKQG